MLISAAPASSPSRTWQTPEQLEAIIRSPQLRSTLASLTGALQTDSFNSIVSNFGLDPSPGLEALTQ